MQSSNENLISAITSIGCVREEIRSTRGKYNESVICRIIHVTNSSNNARRLVRTSIVPREFDSFVVTELLAAHDNLRRIAVECVDSMEQEFSNRFSRYCHQFTTCMSIIWSLSLNMPSKYLLLNRN